MKSNKSNTLANVREIFLRAVEKPTAVERNAFLDGACGSDLELRAKVNELLENHLQDSFLERAPIENEATLGEPTLLTETEGSQIGRYKLLQRIGEGGMGAVFMAEQTEPVRRKVALKIIKLGMDTKSVVARFEAERQALALMDHPNIAKVLDAGATETGRPYFVMELVKGVPFTTYCDRNNLSPKERLDLFVPVCQAIQHAHHKGIIHRDIKPSNILVTLNDGVPHPMVIDFGIAKATNQRLTEKTLFTNYAQMIGTPAYMSPEQAEMSKLDVDTRSDVYSLGVLLYELLTGTTPFPEKELLSKGYGEMQRIITEQDPQRPSLRMSTLQGEEQTVIAKNRSTEALSLSRQLQGDLDWIVMKALEKDRTRRYDTVNSLATDIQNHLTDQPVTAAKPSLVYRFKKLYRREKTLAHAAVAIAACLLLGGMFATLQYLQANRARQAEQIAREQALRAKEVANSSLAAERAQKVETERQRLITNRVNQFLVDEILKQADGNLQVDSSLTLVDAIKNATDRIDAAMPEDSAEKASILFALSKMNTTRHLKRHSRLIEQAYRIRRKILGPDHPETLQILVSSPLPSSLHDEALESYRLYSTENDPKSEIQIGLAVQRCQIFRINHRYEEILDTTRTLLSTAKEHLGQGHEITHYVSDVWGHLLSAQGKHQEAFDHWHGISEELRATQPNTFIEWQASRYAATAAFRLGNYQIAIDRWIQDIERKDDLLAGNGIAIAHTYRERALATYAQGSPEKALRDLNTAFSIPSIQAQNVSRAMLLQTRIHILAMTHQLDKAMALLRSPHDLPIMLDKNIPYMVKAKAWTLYHDTMHRIMEQLSRSTSKGGSRSLATQLLLNLLVSEPDNDQQMSTDIESWINALESNAPDDRNNEYSLALGLGNARIEYRSATHKEYSLALGLGNARIASRSAAREHLLPLTQSRPQFSYQNNDYHTWAALAHIILALTELAENNQEATKLQLEKAEAHARKVGTTTFLDNNDSYVRIVRFELLRDEVRKGLGMEPSTWEKNLPQRR